MPKWTDNIQRVKLSLLGSLRRPHEYHSLPVYGKLDRVNWTESTARLQTINPP